MLGNKIKLLTIISGFSIATKIDGNSEPSTPRAENIRPDINNANQYVQSLQEQEQHIQSIFEEANNPNNPSKRIVLDEDYEETFRYFPLFTQIPVPYNTPVFINTNTPQSTPTKQNTTTYNLRGIHRTVESKQNKTHTTVKQRMKNFTETIKDFNKTKHMNNTETNTYPQTKRILFTSVKAKLNQWKNKINKAIE